MVIHFLFIHSCSRPFARNHGMIPDTSLSLSPGLRFRPGLNLKNLYGQTIWAVLKKRMPPAGKTSLEPIRQKILLADKSFLTLHVQHIQYLDVLLHVKLTGKELVRLY